MSQPFPSTVLPAAGVEATASLSEAELRRYLPEGMDFPAHIPPAIFEVALQTYHAGRRVDMQILAVDAGISRRTLYRKVSDRNSLLAEIHWYNARLIFAEALEDTQHLDGAARLVAVYAHFLHSVQDSEPLIRQLRDEPDNTLKVLTTEQGNVHRRVVAFIRGFLEIERADGSFDTDLPLDALAFAIVRMGESFLYSEVLSGDTADYRYSVEMISRLLRPDQLRGA